MHHISYLDTPEQRGVAKRMHRHVETSLTFRIHSYMPYKYCVDAFNTSIYLFNWLPTPFLQNETPYKCYS